VTVFYGVVDLKSKRFVYSSAGHNPPLHYKAGKKRVFGLGVRKGYPLCLVDGNEFEERSVQLAKGDKLVLYTDGLTETFNPEGNIFGVKRLRKKVKETGIKQAPELAEEILSEVERFRRSEPFHDDFTLLIADIL
jgi:sigma-B regulation protein RsbU (phosphoserine phosphatase)